MCGLSCRATELLVIGSAVNAGGSETQGLQGCVLWVTFLTSPKAWVSIVPIKIQNAKLLRPSGVAVCLHVLVFGKRKMLAYVCR